MYNDWLEAHGELEHNDTNAINARAMRLWPQVKKSWDRLKKHVDEIYR